MLCRGITFIGVKSNRLSGLLLLFLRNMVPSNFYLLWSRQVIELWELLLLLLLLLLEEEEDYFEVMPLKIDLRSRSTFSPWNLSHSSSPAQNFLRGGIHRSLTRFLFGVGSDGINQDLSVTVIKQIFLWGGICGSMIRFLFGVGSLPLN